MVGSDLNKSDIPRYPETDESGSTDDDFIACLTQKDEYVHANMRRVISTHKYCFISRSSASLMYVPLETLDLFMVRRMMPQL